MQRHQHTCRYQLKSDHLGFVKRFRSSLVTLGNLQEPGINYFDTFFFCGTDDFFDSPFNALSPYQCDANTAYLNADLKIVHFIKCIPGFPRPQGMTLYGLHPSGLEWDKLITEWLMNEDFNQYITERCMYVYRKYGFVALLLFYVDDSILASNVEALNVSMFQKLDQAFGIKDQGILHDFLGVHISIEGDGIKMHQTKFTQQILERFGFANAQGSRIPMETLSKLKSAKHDYQTDISFDYRATVGSLIYLETTTIPDIAYVTSYQIRVSTHNKTLRPMVTLLGATKNHGIFFDRKKAEKLATSITIEGFCNADWANCPGTRKSISGFVLNIAGGPVSWSARRQSVVAQPTAEAEYVAKREACMEAVGLQMC
ncbi:LOW QUALITY PROTEIN: hypothetical protein PHMEG_00026969 [Phytophthora megakarya]|uniref:Reverse transcriptase Ty1/copia-type domain-containing protein n=1 Tax=Phytophthora megakarya TaxID=4795 RepID=A0A225VA09_9STRA|nr:LOW QUALITY PROTEIN: hypothetical protein PHMEG_00026969 [Phytophthora megakarya]